MIISYNHYKTKLNTISKLINTELEHSSYIADFSIISVELVRSVHYLNKLTAFLLMKTFLRFGDLYQLDLYHIIHANRFNIIQGKTKKQISLPFNLHYNLLAYELVTLSDFENTLNYRSTALDIKKYFKHKNLFQKVVWNRDCHVFRHLGASWLDSLGYPIDDIASKLGDSPETVKNSYIHPEIFRDGIII